ncbi:hypothetical protein B0H14DRAFT_3891800 [Mycena olivaceomarginata]|nr:hypothetical protein B0H14DRAFT_3891800 [Mycena olivaceomarginata]
MSASSNESLQLSERPLDKKLVSELVEIAKAMNINTAKLHKPEILKAIKAHIQTHPGLGHRSGAEDGGKTSAGKATEEEMESSKPKEPATGPTPLPRVQKALLAGPKGDEIAEPAGAEDFSDLSGSDTPPQSRKHSPRTRPEGEKVEKKHEMSAVIQVNFLDQPTTVLPIVKYSWMSFPIAVSTADNGTKKYTTLLSDLLPAAIQNDSPIKGKIRHSSGKEFERAAHATDNEYNLVPLSDGSFVCDVFWEQPSITHAPQAPQATHLEGVQAVATSTPQEINTITANSRAQFSPLHEHALPGLRAEFVDFLHAKVKAEVPNMPDQGHDWGRCKPLSTSSLVGGGLQEGSPFPKAMRNFPASSFKKELILEVLNIKSSSTSDINKLFAPERLEKAPKAKAWVNSKGETPVHQPGALTCDNQLHIAWQQQYNNRFSRLSFPGVQRVIRRQQTAADNGGVIPALRVELGPLGDTPGDQVVHTFRAKSIYCLQTVQWACGFPIGWGKCYRSESPPQVLAILDRIWLDHPQLEPSFVAYDDACSLLRHIVTQDPHNAWLRTTKFVVDAWHYIGHRATDILCRLWSISISSVQSGTKRTAPNPI